MSASNEPAIAPQAPFPGHPFGGVVRDDRCGNPIKREDRPATNLAAAAAEPEEDAGFDFHLGVYARF